VNERAFVQQYQERRTAELKELKQPPGNDIYKRLNDGHCFISVDINSANFTAIRTYYPNLFRGHTTWEEFILSFLAAPITDDTDTTTTTNNHHPPRPLHTLQFSKFLRERLFGNLRTNKSVHVVSEHMIRRLLTDEAIPAQDIVMLSGDEAVLRYTPELYRRLRAKYHNDTFKVLAFRLRAIGRFEYFCKEYFACENVDDLTDEVVIKRELKCIPREFVMQCIQHYWGRTITKQDLRFQPASGPSATFDRPLDF
jgi:hypothetical protein